MKLTAWIFVLLGILLPLQSAAEAVRLTIYDDGMSCPGNCDAHVVLHPSLNGTEFAHAPATPKSPYSKCTDGAPCELCLVSGHQQCLSVMYRGAGPTLMTFDLTPAFYEQACPSASTIPLLQTKCNEISKAAAGLTGSVNCISEPANPLCKALMDAENRRRAEDQPLYEQCKTLGEAKFNAAQEQSKHRSNDCAYESKATGGPNSKGTTWRRLLPGACRLGTFVGRDGLDCCNGNPVSDGPLGLECRAFYAKDQHK